MTIAIIGCGTMGIGIAQVAATAFNDVIVYDKDEKAIIKAKEKLSDSFQSLVKKNKITEEDALKIFNKIKWDNNLASVKDATLIIEAIVEELSIKQQLFIELEKIISDTCILATNTSSLSVTAIASCCKNPTRVIGIHFFNPAPIMQLVEIVPCLQTDDDVLQKTISLIQSWKKSTIIAKDTPGFIVNRIARPYYSEALRIHEEGTPKEIIDIAMKTIGGFKMGPFELMDFIGNDINYAVTYSVWESFYYDQKYTPSIIQKRLIDAKWYGKKSGKGFYDYSENAIHNDYDPDFEKCQIIFERIVAMLINEAAHALFLNIAIREDIELAMTKGVNYPKGLLQWADEMGHEKVVKILDGYYEMYHEDRYRCSPYLRNQNEI